MRKLSVLIALFCLVVPVAGQQSQQQQQKADPASKLLQFQMVLLKRGPRATPADWETSDLRKEHVAYVRSLIASDKAMIAGRIMDDADLRGVVIFRTKSADEARAWIMGDPAIIAGHYEVEMHPWWSEDVMKKTTTPDKSMTAYLAFLVRGDKWTPEKTPQTEAIASRT
jgi:uncharacterized protein YciI